MTGRYFFPTGVPFYLEVVKMTESQSNQDFPSKPTAESTDEKTFPVKTSLHTEFQKLGKRPKERKNIFDNLDARVKEAKETENIEIVGIENTKAQDKALFAIQKLLENTDYKGNSVGKKLFKGNDFKMNKVILPVLRITPSQYLGAYGVKKYKTSRGKKEFSSRESERALKALYDLSNKKYLFYYVRKPEKKKKKEESKYEYGVISTIWPLIFLGKCYEGLTQQERDRVKSGENLKENDIKLKYLNITICPILIDQIDSYFVKKPANYYQEIELLFPHASKFVHRFINYLDTQGSIKSRKNMGWAIEINYLKLAYKLRMNKYIESKQWKRIKEVLKKCYEIAKKLNYLLSYKTVPGVKDEKEVLELNPQKFSKMQSTDRKRNKGSK